MKPPTSSGAAGAKHVTYHKTRMFGQIKSGKTECRSFPVNSRFGATAASRLTVGEGRDILRWADAAPE